MPPRTIRERRQSFSTRLALPNGGLAPSRPLSPPHELPTPAPTPSKESIPRGRGVLGRLTYSRSLTGSPGRRMLHPRVLRPLLAFLAFLSICWTFFTLPSESIAVQPLADKFLPSLLKPWADKPRLAKADMVFLRRGGYVYYEEAMSVPAPRNGAAFHNTSRGARSPQPHPISILLELAEEEHHARRKRQSKTLRQAVREYRRRYGRNPPKGFDKWWWWSKSIGSLMPDEYDSIARSFDPLLALPPTTLRKRLRRLEQHPTKQEPHYIVSLLGDAAPESSATAASKKLEDALKALEAEDAGSPQRQKALAALHQMGLDAAADDDDELSLPTQGAAIDEEVPSKAPRTTREKIKSKEELLKRFVGDCPDVDLVFNGHDHPRVLVPKYPGRIRTAVANNQHLNADMLWAVSCQQDSPFTTYASRSHMGTVMEPSHETGTLDVAHVLPGVADQTAIAGHHKLVVDPVAASDFCANPAVRTLNPSLKGVPHYTEMLPLLSPYSTPHHRDIIFPDAVEEEVQGPHISFRAKTSEKLWWRAPLSDFNTHRALEWQAFWASQAGRLMRLARPYTSGTDVEYTQPDMTGLPFTKSTFSSSSLATAFLDVAFDQPAKKPPCTNFNCRENMSRLPFAAPNAVDATHRANHSFVLELDQDGDAHKGSLRQSLAGEAVVLKASTLREWWTDTLEPFYHYIPVAADLSDLWTTLAFFKGPPGGSALHMDQAECIAQNGREFTETQWRPQDVELYAFRVALEWARLVGRSSEKDLSFDFIMS